MWGKDEHMTKPSILQVLAEVLEYVLRYGSRAISGRFCVCCRDWGYVRRVGSHCRPLAHLLPIACPVSAQLLPIVCPPLAHSSRAYSL